MDAAYRKLTQFRFSTIDRNVLLSISVVVNSEAFRKNYINICTAGNRRSSSRKHANNLFAHLPQEESIHRVIENLKQGLCSKISNFIENKRTFCPQIVSLGNYF